MNISYKWLKDYVETTKTAQELGDLLTFSGLEVDSVEKIEAVKGGLEHVVIAQVLTCVPHPNSDHLHLTTVDVGGDRPLNIVCGAPNVAAGQKVVCAMEGTQIWTSETEHFTIKKSKMRGEVSEGMLCAEDELGLGASHNGIMVLPDDAVVGMAAKEYFHLEEDYVIGVEITANRGDATSHIGVVRDVVAVLNTREQKGIHINWPKVDESITVNQKRETGAIRVSVEEPELCPRYSGLTIRGITVGPSPDWLQSRLRTIGLRPINNVVDITNFVLMEVGQPLHAFDADHIKGEHVIVKRLQQGTPFVTLDGIERKLDSHDLMICNEKEGMCIAGVFGGEKSGVTEKTVNVFLESAYFNPVGIRKTSKRHDLHTDAAFRYERGCDPNITLWALRRAAGLILELCGGALCGDIIDIYPTPIRRTVVDINFKRVFNLIGQELPLDAMRTALTSLDIEIEQEDAEGMRLLIPTCKGDVYRECDVVEEILRIYGYNNIHFDERINCALSHSAKPNTLKIKNIACDYLAHNGFNEIINNSLTKSAYFENNPDFDAKRCVAILNPLSKELNVMRQTLLYGGLECIARNLNYKTHDMRLFECGHVYYRKPEGFNEELLAKTEAPNGQKPLADIRERYEEQEHLCLFVTGQQVGENWKLPKTETDFFFLKAYVMNIFKRLRVPMDRIETTHATQNYFSEGVTLVLRDSRKELASMGTINRGTLKMMDIKQSVYFADINWNVLLKSLPAKELTYCEVPKFPEVRRDLALVLKKDVTFEQIADVVRRSEKKLLKDMSLFDVYEGNGIANGYKSYAISFILQDNDKTLNDKAIEAVMTKMQSALEKELGAKIRM
ncbi:MAG: phenylalanine--tRNA ligase subunit beta [Bacteroidales bacterium]|nr:phenylalanine--tRNA ligase subunit beta [Bacteroidales bacterium]